MSSPYDPRVYFAAERTLLAWIRTGLAVMGLGFLVARFGLVMFLLRHPPQFSASPTAVPPDYTPPFLSTVVGVSLVVLASLVIAASAWQHLQFCQTLEPQELPRRYSRSFSVWAALLVSLAGIALAGYLIWTSQIA